MSALAGRLSRRWVWGAAAAAALIASLAWGWDWLKAVGIASLLVSLAPCALMCALGLCMRRGGGTAPCHDESKAQAGGDQPASSTSKSE